MTHCCDCSHVDTTGGSAAFVHRLTQRVVVVVAAVVLVVFVVVTAAIEKHPSGSGNGGAGGAALARIVCAHRRTPPTNQTSLTTAPPPTSVHSTRFYPHSLCSSTQQVHDDRCELENVCAPSERNGQTSEWRAAPHGDAIQCGKNSKPRRICWSELFRRS